MGAITLDEYRKRLKENKKNTQNNNLGSDSNQKVTVPNTISYNNYKSKYSPKLSNEATITGNSILLPTITTNNTQQKDEQYLDTGKTYGDYWYQEYSTRKDDKIYSKGGKYYVFNSKTGDYQDVDKISYMTNADVDAKQLEEAKKNGYKGNKADLIKISNKILLDTGDLTKKEYAEYAKDLKRQEEKLNNEQKEKTKIRYSGTGIDAVKQIGSNVSDLSYSANKEIINPIVNFNDNYNIGKQNNELALEYYKKMEGKKNNAEQLEQKINKFNRYNKDLITNPGAAGSAIQNLNTQVESFKKQGIATIAGGTIGGIIGGTSGALAGGAGAIPGAISGAKTGATIGYTFGGVPYTYKLEAGNQYKELINAGIPEKIAKDVSRKTGAINAAIESGENIVDIITLGQAGKLTGAAQQELYDQLEKAYGKKALKTLLIKTGYSYGQNILSESMEEMSQEGTSIHYEKEAFKKAGIDRNVTTEEDLDRVLEAGKSAAISTAFTAPITSLSGSIVTNVVNNLQIKANDRINTISKAEINDEIKKQVINYNNQNSTNLSADEILSIQKQVNNNLEQNNVTIVDNKTEKTLPTVYDIVAQEKVKKERGTSNSTVASSFSDNNISQTNEYVNSINNAKLVKYTDHEIDNFKNGRVKIANNSSDIDIFIETAKKAPSNAKLYFGKIGSNIAKKIKSKLGVEIENYNLSLSANAINHILKNHGDIKTETDRGQVAINDNDFKLIPQIVTEFDDVIDSGLTTEGKKVITFKKRIGDTYYLINYVSDKNHNLEVKTMYKQKKKNSATASDELNPQSWTSETDSGTSSFSDNNIPQINENVKFPIVSNNDMQNNENNTNKIMNPNEISQLTPESANTTPKLPTKNVSTGKGESHFVNNIENKTNMLTKESKAEILDSSEVKYYQEVTNKGSLEKAFSRLNEGGESETLNWFNKDSNKATDVDVAEGWILLKQYQDKIQNATDLTTKDTETRNMVQVAKKLREMGTKAGQTVQAYNILNRLTPEGMVYYAQSELSEAFDIMSKNKTKEWIDSNRNKFNITPQETEFIMKTMEEVQKMEDGYDKRVKLAEIQKVMTDKLPPVKGSGIKAWMRISMLFNPKTQVRNVMGNAIIAPVNTFSDLFASGVDKIISTKTGIRTTGITDVKSYLNGFKKGAYQSYNDFKKGINTRNIEGNRFEITEGKSFNDNNFIGKGLNKVDSLLSFMLDAGDRTFYEATFTNSINNQLKLNNTSEITQSMIDIATSEALSRTWQDNNNYTKFVLNVRKGLNNININGYGLGDVLIPFAKTPANLTKAIVDYSPAGLVNAIVEGNNLRKSLTNGQYNAQMQHQFVQNLGKATAGTMLYVLGIALANAGITSGESDDDKDVANFMKNTLGISSYSIKIGNKSFTYDWAQPVAAPLAITANLMQKQKEKANLYENIISSLDTAGNILLEQSFLESLNTVLSNNEGIATGIQEAVLELPSRAIPTFMKQISDLIDGTQRQTFEKDKPLETAVNKVKAKLPFVSKALAPSVDTMGREIQKYGGKNNLFNVFLNPANINTENISTSAKEIYRLYKSTGDATIMPRVAPYDINQNGEKILLTSKQREEYQKISGDIIETAIKQLLNKSDYKNMNDIEKASIVNKIIGYSYNKARQEVLNIEMSNQYNKINQYINDGGKVADYYLNKEEIDYSYNNPEKYATIKQITNYKNYLNYQSDIDDLKEKYTDSNQRKSAVIKYVNSLSLSIPQKAMLIRLNYSSYDKYNQQIISYINSQNITKDEKTEILTKLGFTIRNGRVYSK